MDSATLGKLVLEATDVKRPRVLLTVGLKKSLYALANLHAPREICGIVRAIIGADDIKVESVALARNIARDPIAGYRLNVLEAGAIAKAWLGSRERVCGVFHTHTLRSATPSRSDLRMMRRLAGLHLIAGADETLRAFVSCRRIVEAEIRT